MKTLAQPPDSDPPPVITPYFRRVADPREAVDAEAAARGLPPEPWAV